MILKKINVEINETKHDDNEIESKNYFNCLIFLRVFLKKIRIRFASKIFNFSFKIRFQKTNLKFRRLLYYFKHLFLFYFIQYLQQSKQRKFDFYKKFFNFFKKKSFLNI